MLFYKHFISLGGGHESQEPLAGSAVVRMPSAISVNFIIGIFLSPFFFLFVTKKENFVKTCTSKFRTFLNENIKTRQILH